EVLSALGDKMPEGLWVGSRYWFLANDSALNKKFVADYFKKYAAYPSYNAHGSYSAVYSYKAAAEKAKSTDKMAIVNALEGLKIEVPTGVIEFRKEDHQAVTDGHWGKTSASPDYPHRILNPIKVFKGKDVTPAVSDTGCSM
ncbi:MAG: ABC transporter substrate-binding protein, partial [Desulfuromonadales bacterium]|nr:ABC transporter substrate-binding protein [Desulfuromonadales bacterium]